ncbi:MAG: hypothetical protein U0936_03465 [Planctomycetaceae bacterium]
MASLISDFRIFSHSRRLMTFSFVAMLVLLLGLPGCGETVDPEVIAIRDRFLKVSTETKETPVSEIRASLKSGEMKPETPFKVRVRVNAGEFPPFVNGAAKFFVTDATGHDGDESHDPHECPFCRRDVKSMMALVEFHDEVGKLIPMDARELFNIKDFELLVIEGTGEFDSEDVMVMTASAMSIVR